MIGGSAGDAEASLALRLARPEDLPALLRLAGDGWPLAAGELGTRSRLARAGPARRGLDRGGKLMGRRTGRRARRLWRAAPSLLRPGFIELVLVGGALRRQGIGRQIVRQLAERCLTPTLWTSTNLSNQPMQALLQGEGFVGLGFIDGLDAGDPELVYSKTLRP